MSSLSVALRGTVTTVVVFGIAMAALGLTTLVANAQIERTGSAMVNPVVANAPTASIQFVDDGVQIYAQGQGSGFLPGRQYVSLVYETRVTTGPGACAVNPNDPNQLNFEQMLVGEWLPLDGTDRTLRVDQPKAISGLDRWNTVSVRVVNDGTDPINLKGFLPAQVFQLRACGLITKNF